MPYPGSPLSMHDEDVEERSIAIQSLQCAGKFMRYSNSMMYSHEIVSKAFAMSILSRSTGVFFL